MVGATAGGAGGTYAVDGPSVSSNEPPGRLFDDFSYPSSEDPAFLETWKASDYAPAAPGLGSFSRSNVVFPTEGDNTASQLMRLMFTTRGSRETTIQGEVEGKRQFLYGTYATRLRFYNQPIAGPAQVPGPDTGDHLVCAFFTISPYYVPNTEYGELDFEYLPNAGWNGDGPRFIRSTLWNTTWRTRDVRITKPTETDASDWHIYWMTVSPTAVSYYLDETLLVTHTDASYIPKTPMILLYNIWLTGEVFAQGQNGVERTWAEDVDWVYHVKDESLTLAQVTAAVADYRKRGTKNVNTLPPPVLPPSRDAGP